MNIAQVTQLVVLLFPMGREHITDTGAGRR